MTSLSFSQTIPISFARKIAVKPLSCEELNLIDDSKQVSQKEQDQSEVILETNRKQIFKYIERQLAKSPDHLDNVKNANMLAAETCKKLRELQKMSKLFPSLANSYINDALSKIQILDHTRQIMNERHPYCDAKFDLRISKKLRKLFNRLTSGRCLKISYQNQEGKCVSSVAINFMIINVSEIHQSRCAFTIKDNSQKKHIILPISNIISISSISPLNN